MVSFIRYEHTNKLIMNIKLKILTISYYRPQLHQVSAVSTLTMWNSTVLCLELSVEFHREFHILASVELSVEFHGFVSGLLDGAAVAAGYDPTITLTLSHSEVTTPPSTMQLSALASESEWSL